MKTFSEIATPDDTLMVVDSINLAFRWKTSGTASFREEYLKVVESLKRSYKAKWVVFAADQGSSSYRKSIYSEYKQNRKDKINQQTEQEKLEFEAFFEEYSRALELVGQKYPVLRFQGVEADDIAAYIVKSKKLYPQVKKVVLISTDADWSLLVSDNVMRFSYVTRKEYTADNWDTHYEYSMDDFISIKCLQGDTGDNVPGVPGVGPKKALALVQQYGSALDIADALPIASKYKYIQNLNEFGAENIHRNYQLMDLLSFCEEAVGPENIQTINTTLGEYLNATN